VWLFFIRYLTGILKQLINIFKRPMRHFVLYASFVVQLQKAVKQCILKVIQSKDYIFSQGFAQSEALTYTIKKGYYEQIKQIKGYI